MHGLLDWIKNHAGRILGFAASISSIEFLADLFVAGSDGYISPEEFASLVKVASPLQVVVIGLVMYALKRK